MWQPNIKKWTAGLIFAIGTSAIVTGPLVLAEQNDTLHARSTVDRLNVRSGPDLGADVLQLIGKDKSYTILSSEGKWLKIALNDKQQGWIFSEYAEQTVASADGTSKQEQEQEPAKNQTQQPATPETKPTTTTTDASNKPTNQATDDSLNTAEPTVVYVTGVTNLRKKPGIDQEVVTKATAGDTYKITNISGEWYEVELPDRSTAYVANWVVETDISRKKTPPKVSKPIVTAEATRQAGLFIYHSHNRESWTHVVNPSQTPSITHKTANITLVGQHLGRQLEERGMVTTVSDADISTLLAERKMTYSQSYKMSREVIESAVATDPNLHFLIDIHRDSILDRNITTKQINGANYARIMFVVGTSHPNYKANQALAESMHELLQLYYPGLSRGILYKSSAQGNGEYNQSASAGSLLLEVGGASSTLQETLYAAEAFADVFARYYEQLPDAPIEQVIQQNETIEQITPTNQASGGPTGYLPVVEKPVTKP